MVVQKNPEFNCCYYNEEDDRSCICLAYNLSCCYQPTCVTNLATTNGKILLVLWITFLLFLIIYGLVIWL